MAHSTSFDLIVLGAGPAGGAAAGLAAARGLDVALVDRNPSPQAAARRPAAVEWLNPAAHETLDALGLDRGAFVAAAVDRVRFMDATSSNTSVAPLAQSVELAWTDRLAAALGSSAQNGGATMFAETHITAIDAREDVVHVAASTGEALAGKLLIVADGGEGRAAEWLGVHRGAAGHWDCCRSCAVETPPARAKSAEPAELSMRFESEVIGRFSYACNAGDATMLGIVSDAPGELDAAMGSALDHFKTAGVFPREARYAAGDVVHRRAVRGLALGMETHVGKRSLLVGEAGGFVCALSGEGLYPAIRSAALAVESCVEALAAAHPQDALAHFDSVWRREMVEYLRLPNVDLRFLLPLVFSNEQMARKLAGAFVCGENI